VGEFDYGSRFEVDDLDDAPRIADIASRLYLLAMSATDVGTARRRLRSVAISVISSPLIGVMSRR
jgi:hypothetical protein